MTSYLKLSLILFVVFTCNMPRVCADNDGDDKGDRFGPAVQPTHFNVYLVSWINNPPYYMKKETVGNTSDPCKNGMIPLAMCIHFVHFLDDISVPISGKRVNRNDLRFKFIDDPKYHFETEDDLLELIQTENGIDHAYQRLNRTRNTTDIFLVSGSTVPSWTTPSFIKTHTIRVPRAAVIVRTADILLLTRFLAGIYNCLGVAFFATTCAFNLAALIWLIEWHSNQSFQTTFGSGLWTSFWFCFVTMTTVGYGDKVPKHFLSRIICLVWMLFGLMLTAIITATVMEAVSKDFVQPGMDIGVKNHRFLKTIITSQLSSQPVTFDTIKELIEAIRTREVDAGLVDVNIAAWYLNQPGMDDLKVEMEIIINDWFSTYILYNPRSTGLNFEFRDPERVIPDIVQTQVRATFVPAITVSPYYVRKFTELFNKQDGGLVLYLTLIAASLAAVGVISELFVKYRRWHSAENAEKRNNEMYEMSHDSPKLKQLEMKFQELLTELKEENNKRYDAGIIGKDNHSYNH